MNDTILEDKKIWVIADRTCEDIQDQVLKNRGISAQQKMSFLNPDYESGLYSPWLLDGMDVAVERILQAIEKKEKIGIFGDYDADGIPATALIYDVLKKHGLEVETFIPKRDEGYGLNQAGINELEKKGVGLIITVDLGITCRREVTYAKEKGIDVIVTDHHEIIEELIPDEAVELIDPKIKGNKYPYRELCGTAVAFKLACALCEKTGRLNMGQLKWYLDLVGISTFCDIVPLQDENRILAKFGLIVLSKTKRLGLKKMYEIANIDKDNINPYVVGFLIGPRLNAPGRMGDCIDALNLLISNDEQEVRKIAKRLEGANTERQEILKKILKEADEKVVSQNLHQKKLIFVSGEGWPEGIIGLVAGRLMDKYSRPVVVVGYQNGIGRGSARSIDGFSMVEALDKAKKYLIKHGGHAKAAGLTVASDQMDLLRDELLRIAQDEISEKDLIGKLKIDAELKIENLDWELYKKLEKLEPYGLGNPRPVFVSYGSVCNKISKIGKQNEHLKVVLGLGKLSLNGVAFGLGEVGTDIGSGDKVDVVYTLDKDDWRGEKNIQLKILDIRHSEERI